MTVSLSSPATDRLKSPQAPLTDPNAQLTKRLYVGGLTPSIASKDLKDRFSMFGTVEEVEEVGVDGLGQRRNFAYLTLGTTAKDLKRCLNVMQGSTWRGAKLKIATAKPKFSIKLASERASLLPTPKSTLLPQKEHRKLKLKERRDKKRKRAEDGGDGYACGDMRVVTKENWEEEGKKWQNWHLAQSGESQILIRPVLTRPTHPIPKPNYPSSMPPSTRKHTDNDKKTDGKKGKTTAADGMANKEKGNEKGEKKVKLNLKPLKRARTIWIDSSRYGRHLGQDQMESLYDASELEQKSIDTSDQWEWHMSNEEDDVLGGGGRWIKVPSSSSSQSVAEPDIEEVPNKRRRLASILETIAATSTYPSTLQEYVPSTAATRNAKKTPKKIVEDLVISLGDDDIWGTGEVMREASPLFADREEREDAGLLESRSKEAVSAGNVDAGLVDSPENPKMGVDQLDNIPGTDILSTAESAGLFDSPPDAPIDLPAAAIPEDDISLATASAGLFDSPSPSPQPHSERIQAQETDMVDSDITTSDEEGHDDEEMSMHEEHYDTIEEFAEAEKKRGWGVLRQLGYENEQDEDKEIEVDEAVTTSADALAQTEQPEATSSASNSSPSSSSSSSSSFSSSEDGYTGEQLEVTSFISTDETVLVEDASTGVTEASDKGDKGSESKSTSVPANGSANEGTRSSNVNPEQQEEDDDVDMDGGASGAGGDDNDDSSSDDSDDDTSESEGEESDDEDEDSSSEDESDSDSDSDSEEEKTEKAEKKETKQPSADSEQVVAKPRQTLKDLFAPKEDNTAGFSLFSNLDLDLDSDLDEDVLAVPQASTSQPQPEEPVAFAPAPVAPGANFDGSLPMFFDFKPPADVQPFARCETDEEMTKAWEDSKLGLTREYKKRHREAVKKQKRGFAAAPGDE